MQHRCTVLDIQRMDVQADLVSRVAEAPMSGTRLNNNVTGLHYLMFHTPFILKKNHSDLCEMQREQKVAIFQEIVPYINFD
jgi:hypothetical protein